ncbi:hypothetical protein [Sphingobium estronivorans]|uniref:hypothetical protein n=1 Tax=Sphingobium estronivorans TaxID=1577690 RepID=UPI00123B8F72|nr:hypothetical protein [Sphingobium estronivorans]
MPKLTDRERLADLEARQKKIAQDILDARRALRGKYVAMLADMEIERLSERECRDILAHAIRAGGAASIAALKSLPAQPHVEPDKRP